MKITEKQAYSEILKALKKYKNICIFDVNNLEIDANNHLFGLKLKNEFGLNIDPKRINSLDWNKFGQYRSIAQYGKKYKRTIFWSDDGNQPEDELLFQISFPTGAYIFGDDYPVNLFEKFFLELKGFNPKYTDNANKGLYFSMDNAKYIFNSFDEVIKKYYDLNKEDYKKRQIIKLKEDLKKLENN